MVLVDTPVWSLALRRRTVDLSAAERSLTQVLYDLVRQNQVQLLGSIRQEVLSGIRLSSQFRRIRDHLRDFPNVEVDSADYEEAARISNECRAAGIATSPTDMLMCSAAIRYGWRIFTTDRDFLHYQRVIRLDLFLPSL
ncbi:MAG TPA: PIN domain-containing protein [Terriglobales bacterium]|jgi:predicted nucleic acid-binding protein|nr:PIN domain-containing protein [Terriglobales bacterium]